MFLVPLKLTSLGIYAGCGLAACKMAVHCHWVLTDGVSQESSHLDPATNTNVQTKLFFFPELKHALTKFETFTFNLSLKYT